MASFRPFSNSRRNFLASLALLSTALLACNRHPEPAPSASNKQPSPKPAASRDDTSFRFHAPHRVVAFGDVHGDLQAVRRALRLAGAIDAKDHWIGGDLVVVQVGDVLDRGDDEVAILDLLRRLRREAKKAGGRLIVLTGNHEVMNVQGDFRYVTPRGFDVFNIMSNIPSPASPRFLRFPVKARARAAAFLPGGPFAKRLAEFPVAVVVDDTLFVHGGLLPRHVSYGLGRINRETRDWMLGKRSSLPPVMQGEDAPIWTRVYSMPEVSPDACRMLDKVLHSLHAKNMVVGHTPQKGGITQACSGHVWRVDVGLASFYGSQPTQLLEVDRDKVRIKR